jgi:hypothetical protein
MSTTIASPSAAASATAGGSKGVFEPKCPFGLGHWGKFLCNIHIAFFPPYAYCILQYEYGNAIWIFFF